MNGLFGCKNLQLIIGLGLDIGFFFFVFIRLLLRGRLTLSSGYEKSKPLYNTDYINDISSGLI